MRIRYVAAVALVVAAMMAPSISGARGSTASTLAADNRGVAVDPGLAAALQQAPSAPVIVSLVSAPVPPVMARSDLSAIIANVTLRADAVLARHPGLQATRRYSAVPAFAATIDATTMAALAVDPDVATVTPDESLHFSLAQVGTLIGSNQVHTDLGVTGAGVTVAVIDSGIDTGHPQLANDLVFQHCYLQDHNCPGGGGASGNSAEDDDGHGTHLSGIITATPGGASPGGIAPDAKIAAFKVSDGANMISTSDVISAYDEIINSHPEIKLINVSLGDGSINPSPLGCDTKDPAMTNAITTARALGATTFASAGNNGSKLGLDFPACITKAIAVGAVYDANVGRSPANGCIDATTAANQVACFSQSNSNLGLLAPGAVITSTWLNGGAASLAGTSQSAAVATAVAALVMQANPLLTPDQLQAQLKRTGVAIRDPGNGVTSCRVDAYAAVTNDPTPNCPTSSDPDLDGVPSGADNCPNNSNVTQDNHDGDKTDLSSYGKAFNDLTRPNSDDLGDACDVDSDNDGISNAVESSLTPGDARCPSTSGPTDQTALDTDGDLISDGAECALGTDPRSALSKPPKAPTGDTDHDGLTDALEGTLGTNPSSADTDGDKLNDGVEFFGYGSDPRNPNSDGDVCTDGREASSLNDDTKVNSTDQVILSQSFGYAGGSTYVPDFDVNRDGAINSTDQVIQTKNYGVC